MPTQRHSNTRRLMAFVKDRPNVWISAFEFEQFGRLCWRTEISRARKRFELAGDGTIENRVSCGVINGSNGSKWTRSEYMYIPASTPEPTTQASDPHNLNTWDLR